MRLLSVERRFCGGRFFSFLVLGQLGDTCRDLGFRDIFGVEGSTIPSLDVCMFWMTWVAHDVEEVFEAGDTSDIFRRGAIGAFDEARGYEVAGLAAAMASTRIVCSQLSPKSEV